MAWLQRLLRHALGNDPWRFWLGVPAAALGANLAPLLVLFLAAVIGGVSLPRPLDLPWFLLAWLSSLFLFPYALLFTLLAGLPAHLLLVLLRRDSAWLYAACGALGGLLAFDALAPPQDYAEAMVALMGLAAGLAGALAFRAIWRPLPVSG